MTSLTEFCREYISVAHHNSGKLPTRQLAYKLNQLSAALDSVLGRPSAVADLTADSLARLKVRLAELHPPKVAAFMVSLFKALLRFAAEKGLVELPDELLPGNATPALGDDTADGSLWSVAQRLYFPLKIGLGPETQRQYRYAFADFGRAMGKVATLADLTDDALTLWVKDMLQRDPRLSAWTINEKAGRIKALWSFLGKRGVVRTFPTVPRLACPEPQPRAWSEAELVRLFEAAGDEPGRIAGVKASAWWQALMAVVWSTSERYGATMALRWEWIDLQHDRIVIPPQSRKGRRKAGVYPLWPEVAILLARIA